TLFGLPHADIELDGAEPVTDLQADPLFDEEAGRQACLGDPRVEPSERRLDVPYVSLEIPTVAREIASVESEGAHGGAEAFGYRQFGLARIYARNRVDPEIDI